MNLERFKVDLIKPLILAHIDDTYNGLQDLFKSNFKTTNLVALDKLISQLQEYRTTLEVVHIIDTKQFHTLERQHLKIILDVVSLVTSDLTEKLLIELATTQQNKVLKLIDLSVIEALVENNLAYL